MAVSDDIKQALYDAIGWQETLADAHRHCSDGVTKEAEEQIKRYRAILKRRYGVSRTALERATDGMTYVSLTELRNRKNP